MITGIEKKRKGWKERKKQRKKKQKKRKKVGKKERKICVTYAIMSITIKTRVANTRKAAHCIRTHCIHVAVMASGGTFVNIFRKTGYIQMNEIHFNMALVINVFIESKKASDDIIDKSFTVMQEF